MHLGVKLNGTVMGGLEGEGWTVLGEGAQYYGGLMVYRCRSKTGEIIVALYSRGLGAVFGSSVMGFCST